MRISLFPFTAYSEASSGRAGAKACRFAFVEIDSIITEPIL